jgi:hypothetical protein
MLARCSSRRSVPHALICAAALLVQSTLLPLLHGEHGAAAGMERALTFAHAGGAAEPELHDDDCAPPASHDAATCQLCATLSGAGAALAPDAVRVGAPLDLSARDVVSTAPPARTTARGIAASRGPPTPLS